MLLLAQLAFATPVAFVGPDGAVLGSRGSFDVYLRNHGETEFTFSVNVTASATTFGFILPLPLGNFGAPDQVDPNVLVELALATSPRVGTWGCRDLWGSGGCSGDDPTLLAEGGDDREWVYPDTRELDVVEDSMRFAVVDYQFDIVDWEDLAGWAQDNGFDAAPSTWDALGRGQIGPQALAVRVTSSDLLQDEWLPPLHLKYKEDVMELRFGPGLSASPGIQEDVVVAFSTHGRLGFPYGVGFPPDAEPVEDGCMLPDGPEAAAIASLRDGALGEGPTWIQEYSAHLTRPCTACVPGEPIRTELATEFGYTDEMFYEGDVNPDYVQLTRLRVRYPANVEVGSLAFAPLGDEDESALTWARFDAAAAADVAICGGDLPPSDHTCRQEQNGCSATPRARGALSAGLALGALTLLRRRRDRARLGLVVGLLSACGPGGSESGPPDADGDGSVTDVDCDDQRADVAPGADEVCDGRDNDCDGAVDEDGGSSWFLDGDRDGYGDFAIVACQAPVGSTGEAGDCDDMAPEVHPGAAETCDGRDDDCDGEVDEDASDAQVWYADADGDGYGDAATAVVGCEGPAGSVPVDGDCDDARSDLHPGASEADCTDPTDYNCDGAVGYADADGDGWAACEDCDDGSAAVRPDAQEACDSADVDEDCDGVADDEDPSATGQTTWYRDLDGDGHGAPDGATLAQCDLPGGYAAVADDCDDTRAAVHPGATEVCDAADLDEDCNGLADDDDAAPDADTFSAYHVDADGDGYGDPTRVIYQCDPGGAYVVDGSDCDDTDTGLSPGAAEVCGDGIDQDCSGADAVCGVR